MEASAAEKMEAMESVKGALQALATTSCQEATDSREGATDSLELLHATGRAIHILERFSDVLEKRPES